MDEICERYGSSIEKLNCITSQGICRQINKEKEIAKQEDKKSRVQVSEVFQQLVNKYSGEVSRLGFLKHSYHHPSILVSLPIMSDILLYKNIYL